MSRLAVKVEPIPALSSEKMITLSDMQAKIRALPVIWTSIKLGDSFFYAPNWNDWGKIIEYLLPKVPPYLLDRFNRETTADWFRVHVAEYFGINTCASVEGWADVGRGYPERHGWNYLRTDSGLVQWEPQTKPSLGFIDPDDEAYRPEYALL